MSTKEQALDALADIEHLASGGLEIDPALFRTVRAALSAPAAQDGWIPVAERMPDSGCVVLACYRNSAGNLRRIRAEWVAAKTQESGGDSDIGEYDEATDTYYDPQGWYERIDNWDDGFSAVGVSQGEVTHWMHLPDAPGAAAPRPAPAEPQPAAQQEPLCMCKDRALSACPGEWEPGCDLGNNPAHARPAGYTQAGERKPLTDEQIDRHSIAAVDCPPSSTVILVSSLRRLLGITATKGER